MGWRTFGECLREKVIAISCEAPWHSHRVENIVVDTAIERSPVASQNLADDRAAGFRTLTKMDVPLVIPHTVQRKTSDGRHRSREVGLTEGAKAVLCAGVDVRIPGVQRHTERVKHQVSGEVSLVKNIHVRVCGETTAVMEVARLRIQLVSQSGIDAILHLLESCSVHHVVDSGCVGEHLLGHFLRAQKTRDYAQLRNVRPNGLAWIATTEQQSRRDIAMVVPRACVAGHSRKLLCRLSSSR